MATRTPPHTKINRLHPLSLIHLHTKLENDRTRTRTCRAFTRKSLRRTRRRRDQAKSIVSSESLFGGYNNGLTGFTSVINIPLNERQWYFRFSFFKHWMFTFTPHEIYTWAAWYDNLKWKSCIMPLLSHSYKIICTPAISVGMDQMACLIIVYSDSDLHTSQSWI